MLKIFLCDDNVSQLNLWSNIINDYLIVSETEATLTLKIQTPEELLIYLKNNPSEPGLYFIDIVLGSNSINGLQLATQIRKLDPRGYIVFISSHSEMSYLTFRYKVEAMDFIIKDLKEELTQGIRSCIKAAVENLRTTKCNKSETLTIKIGSKKTLIDTNEILYIETSKDAVHKLMVHTCHSVKSIYGTLKEMEVSLLNSPNFIRCYKSIIVNVNCIDTINRKNKELILTNGKNLPFSSRYGKILLKAKAFL